MLPTRLEVRLTRRSPTHHDFAYTRADGSGETLSLETKSFLSHDLLHFAVETEASLRQSFYGTLAAGKPYGDLASPDMVWQGEAAMTERVVGSLTGYLKRDSAPPQTFLDGIRNWTEAQGETVPAYLTPDFLLRLKERMRRLQGEWKALPFGRTMTLRFE